MLKKIAIGFLVLLLAGAAALAWVAHNASRLVRERGIKMLEDRFESQVEIQDLRVALFPSVSLEGSWLVLRHHGRTDVPPLIVIKQFRTHESWLVLLGRPWHLQSVQLHGLSIHIPPRTSGAKPQTQPRKGLGIPVQVDELTSDDTELEIIPNDPGKRSHIFAIHRLTMHSVGLGRSAPFQVALTNDTPPGEINAQGQFGPWNRDDPRETPLSASYTFDHADLGVFRGIAGTLSSEGKFGGILEKIEVEGETTVPDFEVRISGHPVLLKTKFSATVDGTNGNTFLHPVIASFGHSSLTCNGEVVKATKGKGREILLNVVASNARLEDLLTLAVKGAKPLMTGWVNLKTRFDLPPGKEEVTEKLRLKGQFGIGHGQFTSEEIRGKIEGLSRRGQGKPDDEDAGSAVTQLAGRFALKEGLITLSGLTFHVTGATVQLDGSYALQDEAMDFHGKLRLDARLSQMTTGFKSFLLKPFDPFFRKHGETELPIKITGTRTRSSFGLDFHRKKSIAQR